MVICHNVGNGHYVLVKVSAKLAHANGKHAGDVLATGATVRSEHTRGLRPRIESADELMVVGSARPMEDAARIAYTELVGWLEELGWDRWEAYEALTLDGALIVYEALIDDERRENALGLLMSLNMLIETPGGFDFTGADCQAWMTEAGFRQTRVECLVGPNSMVIGSK